MIEFQNYHRHSSYTNPRIADCAVKNSHYAERAKELGHKILSTCEHGFQGNVFDCYKEAKKNDLKLLVGAEAYWVKNREEKDRTNCHIFIGAMNEHGRECLNDVLSEANLSGFYGQARLDVPLILTLPKDDVIVTTACVAYWRYDDVEEITKAFAEHFGRNFYLEVQYHNTPAQIELNQRILRLHDELKVPLIMGCDSHYIKQDDAQTRTDFLVSKGITYPEEDGWFLDYPDGDTAYSRFAQQCVLSHSQILDAMANTNVFTDVQEYDTTIFDESVKLPSLYPDWNQEKRDNEYKRLVYSGWSEYKKAVPEEQWPEYEEEIRKEVQTVIDTHFADYFIDNYYIIKRGKENGGWLTKTGRGSAVSFITNKLLGFTEVDRISASVHMYPERFMSTTRILQSGSIPDIDFNVAKVAPFAQAQKDVLGDDHAYPMLAYGTMKVSSAWKIYAKSQGIPFNISNEISKQIDKYEHALKEADDDEKENVNVLDYIDSEYHAVFEKSKDYRSLIVSWSIAPSAFLLYQGSIRRKIGLVRIKDNICCLMDGHWAEEAHFLKNDLLKVSVVDLIYRAFHRIGQEPPSVNELLQMCPPDDPVWNVYEKSCTQGINQVERTGTAARVAKYKPKNISELCAFVAAIRPGFASMYKVFESREPFSYGVKAFDTLLKTKEMPQSFCLYQEQEMAALNYAGIDMSDCYTAIKNIAKKRAEKVLAYKTTFIEGFEKAIVRDDGKTHDEAEGIANELWKIIEDSSRYSFNACLEKHTKFLKAGNTRSKYNPSIEEMFFIKNSEEYAKATGRLSLHKKYKTSYGNALSMFPDGRIRKNKIVDIRFAGVRQVYEIRTETGKQVLCTGNHKFPTSCGLKHCDELRLGDCLYIKGDSGGRIKAYEKGIPTNSEKIVSIAPQSETAVYDIEMSAPAHNIVLENGVVVSNSHSYCVSCDSLYGAWLKTYHPLEFYETLLTIKEEKGDKDSMQAIKQEAEKYFNVRFPAFKYGQDNRSIRLDVENFAINNSLTAIKGFGTAVGEKLYECSQNNFTSFIDILLWLEERSIRRATLEPLVKIGYFDEFGNEPLLTKIMDMFDFFHSSNNRLAKTVKREKLSPVLQEIVSRHATGTTKAGGAAKSFTITDMPAILHECESYIRSMDIPDLDIKVRIQNSLDVLGYVGIQTNREEDRKLATVVDIFPMVDKKTGNPWAYRINAQSLGTGRTASLSVYEKEFKRHKLGKGDVIYIIENDRKNELPYKNESIAWVASKNKRGYWYMSKFN